MKLVVPSTGSTMKVGDSVSVPDVEVSSPRKLSGLSVRKRNPKNAV